MSAQDTPDQRREAPVRPAPTPTVGDLLAVAAAARTLSTPPDDVPPDDAPASRPAERDHPGRGAA